jgi:acetoin utilization deacetylase AcuC-like enzyme
MTPPPSSKAEHYGGYCFVNWAVFVFARLKRAGRRPFLVDVDYHAGDGTASFLSPDGPRPRRGRSSDLCVSPQEIRFVGGFCMGVQGS